MVLDVDVKSIKTEITVELSNFRDVRNTLSYLCKDGSIVMMINARHFLGLTAIVCSSILTLPQTSHANSIFSSFTASSSIVSNLNRGYRFQYTGAGQAVTGLGVHDVLGTLGVDTPIAGHAGIHVSLYDITGLSPGALVSLQFVNAIASVQVLPGAASLVDTTGTYSATAGGVPGAIRYAAAAAALVTNRIYLLEAVYGDIPGTTDNELWDTASAVGVSPNFTILQHVGLGTMGTDTTAATLGPGANWGYTGGTNDIGLRPLTPDSVGNTVLGPTLVFGPTEPVDPDPNPVPEPSSMALLGLAGIALLVRTRRRKTA